MVPDPRALAEWAVELVVHGVEHQITVIARGADGAQRQLQEAAHRETPVYYSCRDSDEQLRLDWGEVTHWSTGRITLHRRFPGPGEP